MRYRKISGCNRESGGGRATYSFESESASDSPAPSTGITCEQAIRYDCHRVGGTLHHRPRFARCRRALGRGARTGVK